MVLISNIQSSGVHKGKYFCTREELSSLAEVANNNILIDAFTKHYSCFIYEFASKEERGRDKISFNFLYIAIPHYITIVLQDYYF